MRKHFIKKCTFSTKCKVSLHNSAINPFLCFWHAIKTVYAAHADHSFKEYLFKFEPIEEKITKILICSLL